MPQAAWTEHEALIVMAKIRKMIKDVNRLSRALQEKWECFAPAPDSTPDHPKTVPCTNYVNRHGPLFRGAIPSFPMLLRFGFHQCLRYADGTGGCNGRLSLSGAFNRYIEESSRFSCRDEGKCRPSEGNGTWTGFNAGLAMLADMLELIYTDPVFPGGTPIFGQAAEFPEGRSLKDTGKSRADLWAFAALVGAHEGLQASNFACDNGNSIYNVMPVVPCKMTFDTPLRFFSGRKDSLEDTRPAWTCSSFCTEDLGESTTWIQNPECKVETGAVMPCRLDQRCQHEQCKGCDMCQPSQDGMHRPRVYESMQKESFPSTWFNGSMISDFFAKDFGFSKRETVAIMGAHSYGTVHGEVSGGFRYDWTHKQTDQLNNMYYRLISLMPSKHFERFQSMGHRLKDVMVTGGVNGSMARTFAYLHEDGKEQGGGHFQWFHGYERCPVCADGLLVDRHLSKWGPDFGKWEIRPSPCCELCRKATKAVRTGNTRNSGGIWTYDIEGLDDEEKKLFSEARCLQNTSVHETFLTVDFALHRKINVEVPSGRPLNCGIGRRDCPVNDLKDINDELPMHEIVEQYATEPSLWANEFMRALEKLLANGATEPLIDSFDFGNVICSEVGGYLSCQKAPTKGAST